MEYKWKYGIVHMYTCTGVYMCVYICDDLENAYYDNVNRNKLEGWR